MNHIWKMNLNCSGFFTTLAATEWNPVSNSRFRDTFAIKIYQYYAFGAPYSQFQIAGFYVKVSYSAKSAV